VASRDGWWCAGSPFLEIHWLSREMESESGADDEGPKRKLLGDERETEARATAK